MLKTWKYKAPILVFLLLVMVYGLSFYADSLGLFESYAWLSSAFHFVGGFLVAYFVLVLYKAFADEKISVIAPRILVALSIISITALVGTFWEFYEFLSDLFLATSYQTTIQDTLLDLFMDIVGSVLFCLFYFAKSRLKLTDSIK